MSSSSTPTSLKRQHHDLHDNGISQATPDAQLEAEIQASLDLERLSSKRIKRMDTTDHSDTSASLRSLEGSMDSGGTQPLPLQDGSNEFTSFESMARPSFTQSIATSHYDGHDAGIEPARPSTLVRFGQAFVHAFTPSWLLHKTRPNTGARDGPKSPSKYSATVVPGAAAADPEPNAASTDTRSDVPDKTRPTSVVYSQRDSGVDMDDASSTKSKHNTTRGRSFENDDTSSQGPCSTEDSSQHIDTVSKSRLHLLPKPSMRMLRAVGSRLSLSPSKLRNNVEVDRDDEEDKTRPLRPQPSKRDLQKRQKLSKKISNLETKLLKARSELAQVVPPMPTTDTTALVSADREKQNAAIGNAPIASFEEDSDSNTVLRRQPKIGVTKEVEKRASSIPVLKHAIIDPPKPGSSTSGSTLERNSLNRNGDSKNTHDDHATHKHDSHTSQDTKTSHEMDNLCKKEPRPQKRRISTGGVSQFIEGLDDSTEDYRMVTRRLKKKRIPSKEDKRVVTSVRISSIDTKTSTAAPVRDLSIDAGASSANTPKAITSLEARTRSTLKGAAATQGNLAAVGKTRIADVAGSRGSLDDGTTFSSKPVSANGSMYFVPTPTSLNCNTSDEDANSTARPDHQNSYSGGPQSGMDVYAVKDEPEKGVLAGQAVPKSPARLNLSTAPRLATPGKRASMLGLNLEKVDEEGDGFNSGFGISDVDGKEMKDGEEAHVDEEDDEDAGWKVVVNRKGRKRVKADEGFDWDRDVF